jgi:hypothetical protein
VACANTIRVTAGERCRTGMNETKTEPRPGPGPGLRCSGRVAGRSSAACVVVTGRRQRFVLHGSSVAPIAEYVLPAHSESAEAKGHRIATHGGWLTGTNGLGVGR